MILPAWTETLVTILTLLVMIVGLLGLIIPILPGFAIIWLAALVYGILNGFGVLGGWIFAVLTIIMLVGTVVDNIVIGAKTVQGGAALSSVLLGMGAGILGTFLLPPFGGLIAAPAVILLLEYRRQNDWARAWNAVRDLAFGLGLSVVVRSIMGLLMIVLWVIWVIN